MGYLDKLLATDERVVRIAHDHWIALLPTILVDLVLCIVFVGLSVVAASFLSPWVLFGFLLLIIPLGHLLFRLWVWWSRRYIITNRRIIQIGGLFNKRVSDTLLEKVNDIVTEQSALGRILGFGDLEVITGSESGIDVFYRLTDPVGFKKDLLNQEAMASSAGQAGSARPSAVEMIADLDRLRKSGVITDAEFKTKKRELLDSI